LFLKGDTMPAFCEPTIHELLNDPITQMVMQADGVDPLALRRVLGSVALEIERTGRQADYQPRRRHLPSAVAAGGSDLGRWVRGQFCGGAC
jgi:hypothetical protein